MLADVPRRRMGTRPETSTGEPQRQLTQRASPELWGRLVYEATRLPHVREGHAESVADARALIVADREEPAVPEATLAPGTSVEPVHLHGVHDTSTHLVLPQWRAGQVCADGWGVPRCIRGNGTEVLVYGPRDLAELAVVVGLIAESIAFARGGGGAADADSASPDPA
jgi:phospholipase/carboxylesterase